jgi:hypothetical protein
MNIINYPDLANEMYDWIIKRVQQLNGVQRTAGIHMTELIYCLTAGYYERLSPLPYTRESAMTMALGIALERLIIPEEKRAEVGTCDGIDYSPDFWFRGDIPSELKTTRMSSNKTVTREFPETWMQQIMGYCYARKMLEYALATVHIMGNYKPPFPEILAVKFTFTQQELDNNWKNLLYRREVYLKAFAEQKPPAPTVWAMKWECQNCRYATSPAHCNLRVAKS